MVAYREIVSTPEDILHIVKMLKEIKTRSEVIIVPLEDYDNDFKKSKILSMSKTWDNNEDEAWNEL